MFLEWVRTGRKRSTVRIGKRQIERGPLEFKSRDQSLVVTVTEVSHKRFQDLSLGDAMDDGFDDFEGFKAILKRIYPELKEDSELTVIRFEYTPAT
jgi:hypothetical protein